RAAPAYRAAYQAQFDHRNVASFAAFEMDRRRLAALEALLAGGRPEDGLRRVETFRRLLHLEGLKRKSYLAYEDAKRHPERARLPADPFWAGVAAGRILPLPYVRRSSQP